MGDQFEIVAGCYEQIAFGYRVCTGGEEFTIEPTFTHHAHTASLTSISGCGKFVATGSQDETIQLYNMNKKTEHGALLHHDGTISCLEFYGASHLLSGGQDGLICVGRVSSLSVHPSGKLALSVGTDKSLRTWNLIEGRSAFIKNIKQMVINDHVDIYSLDLATNTLLAVGGDDESVRIYDVTSQECVCEFKAHENRVKAIDSFLKDDFCVLVSASNDGFIKLWKLNLEALETPSLLSQVNSTARLTCMCVWKTPKHAAMTDTSKEETKQAPSVSRKRVRPSREEVIIEDSGSKSQRKKKKKQKVQ
ncbi:hypothetical protein DNTS_013521 [Danionella cerebrum]|uniref:Anaphase-promoting complex subunit 4 WD40 domain-containing protein n=1 Tax=Danionella cerebrum TaxID=2873325 RepID=A0A553QN26_9TELE|nr:hypothetical protein DNTS_013521 [Danionella translucida]